MHTTVVSLVRNEFPQIRSFMAHAIALFDKVVVVDHMSEDGTLEELLRWKNLHPNVKVFQYVSDMFRPSLIVSFLANHEIESGDTDWVFFLDGDEFFPFESREGFHKAMSKVENENVILIKRRDLVPASYDYEVPIGQKFLAGPVVIEGNIAVRADYVKQFVPVCVGHANLELLTHPNGYVFPSTYAGFNLYHIPIRSIEQLTRKVTLGSKALPSARAKISHWTKMKEMLDSGIDLVPLMNAFVVLWYGESRVHDFHQIDLSKYTYDGLKESGHQEMSLDIAYSDFGEVAAVELVDSIASLPKLSIDNSANVLCDPVLVNEKKKPSQADLDKGVSFFNSLSSEKSTFTLESTNRAIIQLIGNRLPVLDSLQEYNIPFFYTIISLLRPRRYVELGPDLCVSAFAAGQTMHYNHLSTASAAVYSWQREFNPSQSVKRFRESFGVVKSRLSAPRTSDDLEQTEALFNDNSIDLLQINVRHGYDNIEKAYEKWLPKLSPNGCILLNDTNGRATMCDVQKFFAKIQNQVPAYFELHTGSGIGVIAFGDRESNPISQAIAAIGPDRLLLETCFTGFSSDKSASMESIYVAEYLKTAQKYGSEKRFATFVRWLKRASKAIKAIKAF